MEIERWAIEHHSRIRDICIEKSRPTARLARFSVEYQAIEGQISLSLEDCQLMLKEAAQN